MDTPDHPTTPGEPGDGSPGSQASPIGALTAEEMRVLGCLIEKEATTPDSYPLTLNALRNACNQSTSRHPVVEYADHDVERALASLRERRITRTVHSRSNRAAKYRHVLPEVIGTDPAETALVAVLMLRGPQTVGELKSRTERQHRFGSTDEVAGVLDRLAARPAPLVHRLERRPGQKDARWVQLLGAGDPAADDRAGDSADDPAALAGRAASGHDDPYGAATAEFYDLVATHDWERFGLELLVALDGVDPAAGPVVDLGAGTGAGLAYIREAIPGAAVYAVEPSKAMRTALHARLAADPGLRAAVTVDPRPFDPSLLPARACALVMSAVIGHLSDTERAQLWHYVADAMAPGAPAVFQLLPPASPVEVPPTRYSRVDVGRFAYEGWQEGAPADDRHMWWTMSYRVLDGATVVAEYSARSRWRCLAEAEIRDEVEPLGLTLTLDRDEHGAIAVVRTQ